MAVMKFTAQDLYVMQNEHGLIKVGRSVDAEKRRRALEVTERCRIVVVSLLSGQGEREEQVHLKLRRHLIEGEWFNGTAAARRAAVKTLGLEPEPVWPFAYDRAAAEVWLESFFGWRDERAIDRLFGRLLTRIRSVTDPAWIANCDIWHLLCVSETGERPVVSVEGDSEKVVLKGWLRGAEEPVVVPEFISDLAACLELWPADVRPAIWEGTAHECAIAALEERRRRFRQGRRWI